MDTLVLVEDQISSETRNNAFTRVDGILRAYGIEDRISRSHQVLKILEEANLYCYDDTDDLEQVAADLALKQIDATLKKIAAQLDIPPDTTQRRRLLLLLHTSKLLQRKPEYLLSAKFLPQSEVELLLQYRLTQGPDLQRSTMGNPTLDFSDIDNITHTYQQMIRFIPGAQYILASFMVIMLIYLIYLFSR
ncbi:MAG: hypothetical protein AAGA18_06570 [Verrucomicrobiota bacterium]